MIGVAILSPLAYILVLTALEFTPVSYVAPAREISILVGTIFGALIGSLLMGLLNNGLILMGLSVSEQLMVRGLIILAAIALTLREARR